MIGAVSSAPALQGRIVKHSAGMVPASRDANCRPPCPSGQGVILTYLVTFNESVVSAYKRFLCLFQLALFRVKIFSVFGQPKSELYSNEDLFLVCEDGKFSQQCGNETLYLDVGDRPYIISTVKTVLQRDQNYRRYGDLKLDSMCRFYGG